MIALSLQPYTWLIVKAVKDLGLSLARHQFVDQALCVRKEQLSRLLQRPAVEAASGEPESVNSLLRLRSGRRNFGAIANVIGEHVQQKPPVLVFEASSSRHPDPLELKPTV